MNKFNSFIEQLLEVDATQHGISDISSGSGPGGVITGNDVLAVMKKALSSKPDAVRELDAYLGKNAQLKGMLDKRMDSPEEFAAFMKAIGITEKAIKQQMTNPSPNANDTDASIPDSASKEDKKSFWKGKAPSGAEFGNIQYSPYQSDIENAIWDTWYWIKNGSLLKKLQTVGGIAKKGVKSVAGAVSPTAAGSTGVFS